MPLTAWNRITGIQSERIAEVDQLSHREWLEVRKQGIGGSDISALAGCNPWKSAIHVFLEKTGRFEVEPNEKMKWGNILEDPVAREYSDSQEVKVQRVKAVLKDSSYPHFLANIDRMIVKGGHDSNYLPVHDILESKGNGILEVKTTGWAQAWEGEDIPDMYYLQLQWYLMVTGLRWGQFAVLVSGQDFLTSKIVLADEGIHNSMREIADKFWCNHVKKDVAPEPDSSEASYEGMKLIYPNAYKNTVQISDEYNEIFNKRKELKASIKQAEQQVTFINSKAIRLLENNKWGETNKWKLTKVEKSGLSFDKKSFKEDHPDMYLKYTKSSSTVYPLFKAKKFKTTK